MIEKSKIISKPFWSNCYIEAFRQKLLNPKIKLIFIPGIWCKKTPHRMWSDGEYDYDFSDSPDAGETHLINYIWYKGVIRQFRKGFANKWKGYIVASKNKECL